MLERIVRRIDASPVLFHLVNLLVASVWVYRAYVSLSGLPARVERAGTWNDVGVLANLVLLFNLALLVVFFVFRRRSKEAASDLPSILFAHLGTWLPLFFGTVLDGSPATLFGHPLGFDLPTDRPTLPCVPDGLVRPLVYLMALMSCVITLGFVSLGRSWGIIPANRGVRTGGLYRLVRHPIYAAYVVFDIAYPLVAASWLNVGLAALVIATLYVRTIYEERVLLKDPEYAAYAQRTRSKLIPWVI